LAFTVEGAKGIEAPIKVYQQALDKDSNDADVWLLLDKKRTAMR